MVRRHTAPQHLVARARIVLAAAADRTNGEIARRLDVAVDTVRLWRGRWASVAGVPLAEVSVAERLADAPRAGRPARIGAEQSCQVIALACEAPGLAGRPISHWSGREIAEEAVARGSVDAISPRHAARLVTRGTGNRIGSAPG